MTALVSVDAVVRQLRVGDEASFIEMTELAEAATSLVLTYIAGTDQEAPAYQWTPETVPADVRKAILVVAMNLYDMQPGVEVLSETVKEMVLRHRILGVA